MTIDRRKIFTVGMVWTDFVKRLPRTLPRYRNDYVPNLQQFAGLGTLFTDDQLASLRMQQNAQLAAQNYNPAQFQPFGWTGNLGCVGRGWMFK